MMQSILKPLTASTNSIYLMYQEAEEWSTPGEVQPASWFVSQPECSPRSQTPHLRHDREHLQWQSSYQAAHENVEKEFSQ